MPNYPLLCRQIINFVTYISVFVLLNPVFDTVLIVYCTWMDQHVYSANCEVGFFFSFEKKLSFWLSVCIVLIVVPLL